MLEKSTQPHDAHSRTETTFDEQLLIGREADTEFDDARVRTRKAYAQLLEAAVTLDNVAGRLLRDQLQISDRRRLALALSFVSEGLKELERATSPAPSPLSLRLAK